MINSGSGCVNNQLAQVFYVGTDIFQSPEMLLSRKKRKTDNLTGLLTGRHPQRSKSITTPCHQTSLKLKFPTVHELVIHRGSCLPRIHHRILHRYKTHPLLHLLALRLSSHKERRQKKGKDNCYRKILSRIIIYHFCVDDWKTTMQSEYKAAHSSSLSEQSSTSIRQMHAFILSSHTI